MPKYLFTLNMPSSQGNKEEYGRWEKLVHQVIGEHSAPTLEDLLREMEETDYILVTQMYKILDRETGTMTWETRDRIVINMQHVGKVQKYEERNNGPRRPFPPMRDKYA